MQRCLQLAKLGSGSVAPNPMVGAVLVYQDRIIGEGYHRHYGGPHAEVNCLASVEPEDRVHISASTLYVSLEPCAHFGKTPPCTDLVISSRIPKVVIGMRDPFEKVAGRGIGQLREAGIDVQVNVLEEQCSELNKRFLCFHNRKRPYVILKWAQTADGFISGNSEERLLISNEYTNRYVHKWRSEEAAILVGATTALKDNPSLDVRLWKGRNPIRMVVDPQLRLPSTLNLFNGRQRTIVFSHRFKPDGNMLEYFQLNPEQDFIDQFLGACFRLNVQSVIVEGGARLLQSFVDAGKWDEARVITNLSLHGHRGLAAPVLQHERLLKTEALLTDTIHYFAADVNPR